MSERTEKQREERRTRQLVNEILTRPRHVQNSKKGSSGIPINVIANYFKLKSMTDWTLYHYRVDIAPDEERTIVRKALLRTHKAVLGAYMFDGTMLYTSSRFPEVMELNSIRQEDRQPMNIKIRMVGDLVRGDYHYFQFFNILVRKCLEHLQLQLVGRNYFDAGNKVEVREYKLELWPGYVTSIRQHEQNIFMCAEISHKVMRNQTVYDILKNTVDQNKQNYQKIFKEKIIGNVVLTDYNNKTYRIDDVDFSINPSRTFRKRDGSEISYATYYTQRYQITIRDLRQPLLASRSSARDRRAGNAEVVYLIPELCRATGLTDDMRNDFRLMKAVADHTRINPATRIQRLMQFNQRLQSKPDVVQEFTDWNFQLERNLVEFRARVLPVENILGGGGKKIIPKNADWNFELQNFIPITAATLKDWIAICPSKSSVEAKIFIDAMIKAAADMKMSISRPRFIEITDDRTGTYGNALSRVTDGASPQLILCIVSNNQQQRYSIIKKKLCIDRPIPSQVILSRTLCQKSNSMMKAVSGKVAIQLNCKLGGIPWSTVIAQHLPGMMVCGFDVCHGKDKQGIDYGAMVASLDQNFGRYFSAVSKHAAGEELSNDLSLHFERALKQFHALNKKLPAYIIIYRDGVGEGQIPFVKDYEVGQIKKKLSMIYGNNTIKLAYIIVTKRINTRIFTTKHKNPPSGTVVDDVITDPLKYDFFIVSQSVHQGTVAPTAYNVIEDTTGLSADNMQMLTYKFCHMYYNFSGTVRVPAPCQYAHKLAFFISQTLSQPAHPSLEKLLYFL